MRSPSFAPGRKLAAQPTCGCSAHLSPEQELALRATSLPEGLQRARRCRGACYPLDDVARPVVGLLGTEGYGLEGIRAVSTTAIFGAERVGHALLRLARAGVPAATKHGEAARAGLEASSPRSTSTPSPIAELKLRDAVSAHRRQERDGDLRRSLDGRHPRDGDRRRSAPARTSTTGTAPSPTSTSRARRSRSSRDAPPSRSASFQPTDSFWVDKRREPTSAASRSTTRIPRPGGTRFAARRALSSNVCYAHIGTKVGATTLYDYARLFGFWPADADRAARRGAGADPLARPLVQAGRSRRISIGQESSRHADPDPHGLRRRRQRGHAAPPAGRVRGARRRRQADPRGSGRARAPGDLVRNRAHVPLVPARRGALRAPRPEAALPWCEVAGKTGTAQKTGEDGRGYGAGCYVSSFVGMAPAEDPKVVGAHHPRRAARRLLRRLRRGARLPGHLSPRGPSRDAARSRSRLDRGARR